MQTRSTSKWAISAVLFGSLFATTLGQPAEEWGGHGKRSLKGTIWVGKKQHRRVTVSTEGDITIKEGKNIYVHFIEKVDDIYVMEVRWWNVTANINVLEHGVLTKESRNVYRYIEADHHDFGVPNDDFPGIIGRGTFELLEGNRAKLIQIGHLVDGSASGFTVVLKRAHALPKVPIPQTYP